MKSATKKNILLLASLLVLASCGEKQEPIASNNVPSSEATSHGADSIASTQKTYEEVLENSLGKFTKEKMLLTTKSPEVVEFDESDIAEEIQMSTWMSTYTLEVESSDESLIKADDVKKSVKDDNISTPQNAVFHFTIARPSKAGTVYLTYTIRKNGSLSASDKCVLTRKYEFKAFGQNYAESDLLAGQRVTFEFKKGVKQNGLTHLFGVYDETADYGYHDPNQAEGVYHVASEGAAMTKEITDDDASLTFTSIKGHSYRLSLRALSGNEDVGFYDNYDLEVSSDVEIDDAHVLTFSEANQTITVTATSYYDIKIQN